MTRSPPRNLVVGVGVGVGLDGAGDVVKEEGVPQLEEGRCPQHQRMLKG